MTLLLLPKMPVKVLEKITDDASTAHTKFFSFEDATTSLIVRLPSPLFYCHLLRSLFCQRKIESMESATDYFVVKNGKQKLMFHGVI